MATDIVVDLMSDMLLRSVLNAYFVVRKHPNPIPIIMRKKDGSYLITFEVTQGQMNIALENFRIKRNL